MFSPFLVKFRVYFIMGQWGELVVTNDTVYLHLLFGEYFCFSLLNLCCFYFHFFFDVFTEFPWQNFNQSEARIGDKKLSVKLHA